MHHIRNGQEISDVMRLEVEVLLPEVTDLADDAIGAVLCQPRAPPVVLPTLLEAPESRAGSRETQPSRAELLPCPGSGQRLEACFQEVSPEGLMLLRTIASIRFWSISQHTTHCQRGML